MERKDYPLQGIRVIDFSTVVAGPTTARMLADMGAEVIKVESKAGDPTRYTDALPTLVPDSYCFTNCNANKKSIVVNIKNEEGKKVFLKLLASVDILVTNVRYKSLIRAGLDYETIKERFPKLIYAHFSGYGYEGEDCDLPGYDMSGFWSRGGSMLDGHLDDSHRLFEPAYGMGDLFCAGYFTSGILAALYARQNTGHGTRVTTSLLHSGVWANSRNIIPAQKAIGDVVPLPEKWNYNMFYRGYRCSDGKWVMLAFQYIPHFKAACEVFGLEDIADDPRYQTQGALRNNEVCEGLAKRLEKTIASKPRDYWMEKMRERDLVYAPIQSAAEVSEDPQVLANRYMESVRFGNGKEALMPSIPIQFTDYGMKDIVPAVRLGANTNEVLSELGYTQDEIHTLTVDGSVR